MRARMTLLTALVLAACEGSVGDTTIRAGTAPEGARGPGNAAPGDVELVQQVLQKLADCALGDATPRPTDVIYDAYDRCAMRCLLDSSCEDAIAFLCFSERENAFSACDRECPVTPPDGYACADGTKLRHAALCDGEHDCRGGEDEDDCGFACADGSARDAVEVCDGEPDCPGGEDEAGCLSCPG